MESLPMVLNLGFSNRCEEKGVLGKNTAFSGIGNSVGSNLETAIKVVGEDEFTRIGILVHGIRDVANVRFHDREQVIPRVEMKIGEKERHTTLRINANSPFRYVDNFIEYADGTKKIRTTAALFERSVGSEDYSFSPIRENGSSLVFDWVHAYCSNRCDFCFKEYDWAMLSLIGQRPKRSNIYNSIENNLNYITSYLADNELEENKYPFIWLCTGTLENPLLEREQHLRVLRAIRKNGYNGKVFMSIAPPKDIVYDRNRAMSVFKQFHDEGLNRVNSGMELVHDEFRKKYIKGFKGTLTCEDYFQFLEWATKIYGRNIGSCVLIGLEPHEYSLKAIKEFSKRGIQSVPTIYTSFVPKQLENKIYGEIDKFITTSLAFKEVVKKYNMEIFESVFGLI